MDLTFDVYHRKAMSPQAQEKTRNRIDWLCSQAYGNVLDAGCSQGLVPYLMAQQGLQVVGIDIDEAAIAVARGNMQQLPAPQQALVTLYTQNFTNFTCDTQFDTIIADEYLEHLSAADLIASLEKIATLLSADGQFLCTVPLGLHPHPDHHQTFFPRTLHDLLRRYFSIKTMEVADGFMRCVCSSGTAPHCLTEHKLLLLCEKAIEQIQSAYSAKNKGYQHVLQEASPEGGDNIAQCLEDSLKKASGAPSVLGAWLEQQGLKPPYIYDIKLFSALNTYYATRPIVPQPRNLTEKALFSQADTRVDYLQRIWTDLQGQRCLEVGCGRGETAVRLAERAGCHVTGVDITRYAEWEERWSDSTKFLPVDLTQEAPFRPDSFGYVYSFVVFEHVQHPKTMLTKIHRLLQNGGKLYFTANLYRGPMASHRYREVYFPWPHLLFADGVFNEYYRNAGYSSSGTPAWVNKMTHLHYLSTLENLKMRIKLCNLTKREIDQEFYTCFEEKLGKYPTEDLEIDFIKIHAEK